MSATATPTTPRPQPPNHAAAGSSGAAIVKLYREFAQWCVSPAPQPNRASAFGCACCRFVLRVLRERPLMLGSYHATIAAIFSVCDTALRNKPMTDPSALHDAVDTAADGGNVEAYVAMTAAIVDAWWAHTMLRGAATPPAVAAGSLADCTTLTVDECGDVVSILLALSEERTQAPFGSLSSLATVAGAWRRTLGLQLKRKLSTAATPLNDSAADLDAWAAQVASLVAAHQRSTHPTDAERTPNPSSFWLDRNCWTVVWETMWCARSTAALLPSQAARQPQPRTALEVDAALCTLYDIVSSSISDAPQDFACNDATPPSSTSLVQDMCVDVVMDAVLCDPVLHWPSLVVDAIAVTNSKPSIVDAMSAQIQRPQFADALVSSKCPATAVAAAPSPHGAQREAALCLAVHDVQCYAAGQRSATGRRVAATMALVPCASDRSPIVYTSCLALVGVLLEHLFTIPFARGVAQQGTAVDLELTALVLLAHAQRRLAVAPLFDGADRRRFDDTIEVEVALLAAAQATVTAVAREHGGLSVPRSVLSRWRRTLVAVADHRVATSGRPSSVLNGAPLYVCAALPKDAFAVGRCVSTATGADGCDWVALHLVDADGSPAGGMVPALLGGPHPSPAAPFQHLLEQFSDAARGHAKAGPRQTFQWAPPADAVTATIVVDGWLLQTVDVCQLHVLHVVLHHAYPSLFLRGHGATTTDAIDVECVVAAHLATLRRDAAPHLGPPTTSQELTNVVAKTLTALQPLFSLLRRRRDAFDWQPDAPTMDALCSATFGCTALVATERLVHATASTKRRSVGALSSVALGPGILLRAEAFLVRRAKVCGTITVAQCTDGYIEYVQKHSAGLDATATSEKRLRQIAADSLLTAIRSPQPQAAPDGSPSLTARLAAKELLAAARSAIGKGFLTTSSGALHGDNDSGGASMTDLDERQEDCRLSFVAM